MPNPGQENLNLDIWDGDVRMNISEDLVYLVPLKFQSSESIYASIIRVLIVVHLAQY
jgi:hypothetical protein